MRRAFLLAGIAAGAIVLFTSTAVVHAGTKSQRLQRHLTKVQDLAFCEKGYEIAGSFPSFFGHKSKDQVARRRLLAQATELQERKQHIGQLLQEAYKTKALDLGMDEFSYDNTLARFQAKAEVEAVVSFQSVGEPEEFLSQLNDICESHLTE